MKYRRIDEHFFSTTVYFFSIHFPLVAEKLDSAEYVRWPTSLLVVSLALHPLIIANPYIVMKLRRFPNSIRLLGLKC